MQFIWRYWESISSCIARMQPSSFSCSKHNSLLYYMYYALDTSMFLEKSTFLSTWQPYSACIDKVGSRAQGNMLICSVSCCSFMLVRSTHVLHSLLPSQSTVESDFRAENNAVLLTRWNLSVWKRKKKKGKTT